MLFSTKNKKIKYEYWTLNMTIFESKNILKYIQYLACKLSNNLTGEYLLKMINHWKVKQKLLCLEKTGMYNQVSITYSLFYIIYWIKQCESHFGYACTFCYPKLKSSKNNSKPYQNKYAFLVLFRFMCAFLTIKFFFFFGRIYIYIYIYIYI